jgi:hypothetical protein
VRNSIFNWDGQNIYLYGTGVPTADDWKIYGNLFYLPSPAVATSSAAINSDSSSDSLTNLLFYNNTVYNYYYATHSRAPVNSGLVKNNIFIGLSNYVDMTNDFTHDYNASDESLGEAHGQSVTSSIFNDTASADFTLKADTDAGEVLGAPFNVDMLGNTRGADSTWDRGAYEYTLGVGAAGTLIGCNLQGTSL